MLPEIKLFIESLKKNPLAVYFANQIFSKLSDESALLFGQTLTKTIQNYVAVDEIQSLFENESSNEKRYQAIFELFPSFGLIFSWDILSATKDYKLAKSTLITWMLGTVLDLHDYEKKEVLFLNRFQPDSSKEDCSRIITPDKDLPLTIITATQRDIAILIKRLFPFKPTKDIKQRIEDMFCFVGLSQIFLRYHFDLITQAPSDLVASYIDSLFSKLNIILRLSEISYWKKTGDAEIQKARILQMVDLNIRNKRHPILQKAVFSTLYGFHPIVHDGRSRGMAKNTHLTLQKQLNTLKTLSAHKTGIIANTILKTKGSDHAVYFLTQLLKLKKEGVQELSSHLTSLQSKQYETLTKLVNSFLTRFQPKSQNASQQARSVSKPKLILSQNSSRLSSAKKKLDKIKTIKGMMTHDKVTAYLQERLKKLYERVKMSGALTQNQIPEYLAQFAAISEPILKAETSPSRQRELVQAFEESTDEILAIMAEQDTLSNEEIAEVKIEIKEQIDDLESPDLETRTVAVEKIGITLTEASEKSEKRKSPSEYADTLKKEEIYIGFNKMAQPMPMLEFLALPLGERTGPPEDNWFEQHKLYLDLAVQNEKLNQAIVDTVVEAIPALETPSYKKYFNVFPDGQYEETVVCAIYDIWKSKALHNLRMG